MLNNVLNKVKLAIMVTALAVTLFAFQEHTEAASCPGGGVIDGSNQICTYNWSYYRLDPSIYGKYGEPPTIKFRLTNQRTGVSITSFGDSNSGTVPRLSAVVGDKIVVTNLSTMGSGNSWAGWDWQRSGPEGFTIEDVNPNTKVYTVAQNGTYNFYLQGKDSTPVIISNPPVDVGNWGIYGLRYTISGESGGSSGWHHIGSNVYWRFQHLQVQVEEDKTVPAAEVEFKNPAGSWVQSNPSNKFTNLLHCMKKCVA